MEWISSLKVVDLREQLRSRGLSLSGKKADLAARLTAAVEAEGPSEPQEPDNEVQNGADPSAAAEDEATAPQPQAEDEQKGPVIDNSPVDNADNGGAQPVLHAGPSDENPSSNPETRDGPRAPDGEQTAPAAAAVTGRDEDDDAMSVGEGDAKVSDADDDALSLGDEDADAPEEAPVDKPPSSQPTAAAKRAAAAPSEPDQPASLKQPEPKRRKIEYVDPSEAAGGDAAPNAAAAKPSGTKRAPIQFPSAGPPPPADGVAKDAPGTDAALHPPSAARDSADAGSDAAATTLLVTATNRGKAANGAQPKRTVRELKAAVDTGAGADATEPAGTASASDSGKAASAREPEPRAEPAVNGQVLQPRNAVSAPPSALARPEAPHDGRRKRKAIVFDVPEAKKEAPPPPKPAPVKRVVEVAAVAGSSRAMKIEGMRRPFTEADFRQLLQQTGTITAFWMSNIKTHAYVVFETVQQAEATAKALHMLEWPARQKSILLPSFVAEEEAAAQIEAQGTATVLRVGAGADAADAVDAPGPPRGVDGEGARLVDADAAADVGPGKPGQRAGRGKRSVSAALSAEDDAAAAGAAAGRGGGLGGGRMEEEEPAAASLEDFFRKTEATPVLYWLPLSEERVAEKLAAKGAATMPAETAR